jgi:hypothetical protein
MAFDTEAIENTAREMGFLEDVKEIDERVPSLFQALFAETGRSPGSTSLDYL